MFEGIRVSAIAAVADNGVIGVDGDLPWHIPDDLRWFKGVTRGHAIIMGRKTWQSLPKPLPRRLNVVLTRSPETLRTAADKYRQAAKPGSARLLVVDSLEDALSAAAAWEREAVLAERVTAPEIMVVGGGGIYAALWPWVDRFYRTRVTSQPRGDAFFPAVDVDAFTLTASQDGAGEPLHVFETLDR